MFQEITHKITAEEIKNRILAYAALQAAREKVDQDYWYGNIATYTLNLRLSGIYGEKQFNDVLSCGADTTLNIGKYPYLENEVFLQETQHLDDLNFVKQLYQAFLAREADPGGLEGNLNQLKNDVPRANLVIGLRNSGEADNVFLRVSQCLDNENFLEITYRVYLQPENRQTRWSQDLASLDHGISRESLFRELKQFQQLQTALQHRQGDFYRQDSIFLQNTQEMSNEDFVKELYLTYCKREADPGGLEGNVQQLNNGVARSDLLYTLRTSEEAANVFVDLTAGLDNSTFIRVAYLAYRKEELTPDREQQCLAILEAGNIRQTILRDNLVVPTPEETILEAIEPETQSSLEIVIEQLQTNFARKNNQFLIETAHLNNEEFIQQLYLTYLQREVDPDGLASNRQQLKQGVAREVILHTIKTSQEAANVFVNLTANLDDLTFIELAYQYYCQQELTEAQKSQNLASLALGEIRQTILTNCSSLVPILEIEETNITLENYLENIDLEDTKFIEQTEKLNNEEFIREIYQNFFLRKADVEGLKSHVEQLEQDVTRWELLYDLRTSSEATNVFLKMTQDLDNSQFLELTYAVYFKRKLDPENKAAYLKYLEQGNPRQDIFS